MGIGLLHLEHLSLSSKKILLKIKSAKICHFELFRLPLSKNIFIYIFRIYIGLCFFIVYLTDCIRWCHTFGVTSFDFDLIGKMNAEIFILGRYYDVIRFHAKETYYDE